MIILIVIKGIIKVLMFTIWLFLIFPITFLYSLGKDGLDSVDDIFDKQIKFMRKW